MKTKLFLSFLFSLFLTTSVEAQWFQQTSGTTAAFSSIHCVDSNNCFVAGTTTTVRKTTDGTTWNVTGTTGITSKSFIKMYSKDTIILGQVNGNFRRTTNAGTSWSNDILGVSSSNVFFNDVAFTSNTNFIAVGGNAINHISAGNVTASSTNTGLTWPTVMTGSGDPTFFGIHAINSSTFVACGGAASVYKSIDAGANWTVRLNGTPSYSATTLYDINFPTPTIGYAVGGSAVPTGTITATGGVVYKSIDAGQTWTVTATGLLPNTLYGVHFVNKDTGYVVGDGGKIQITLNGGTSWSQQISPVTTTLTKIYFATNKIGYICGVNGVILKTTNGGFIAPLVADLGPDSSICLGDCITLGAATVVSGGTTPYTYLWSNGSSASSILVCPTVMSSYTLTITDVNNGSIKDSVKVSLHTNPVVSLAGLDAFYCDKASSDTLAGTPGGGTYSGSGISAGDSIFNAVLAGAGTHTITYTYTSSFGCVIPVTKTTTVLPSPASVPLCLVTVDSAISNTSNIVVWVKPAVTNIDSFRIYRKIANIMTVIATVPYSAPSKYVDSSVGADPKTNLHEYAIRVVDTCGKESALSAIDSTMYLTAPVFNLPSSFALTWTDLKAFTFTNYEVWRTIDNGANWTMVNTVAYAAAPTYTDLASPSLSARYRIRATAPSSCNTGSEIFKYSLSNVTNDYTGISELSLNNLLNVYPNPNQGTFRVELSGSGYEVTDLKVYNMLGEILYHSSENNKVSEIHIPGITPGIYHLEVITDKGIANKKITIQ